MSWEELNREIKKAREQNQKIQLLIAKESSSRSEFESLLSFMESNSQDFDNNKNTKNSRIHPFSLRV
ncbi:MAG: hypothetical protein N2515_00365 [Deltaproteobacteria bacterium]|nr:hypothetical protein [Deltaproteobacteria bacterium]